MLILLNSVSSWLCSQCGHLWPVLDAGRPPRRCTLCHSCRWQAERDDAAELPGA